MRTALDIQQRLESLHDRLGRLPDNRSEIVDDMRQIVMLAKRWSWSILDRKPVQKLTRQLEAFIAETEAAETDEDIVAAVQSFAGAIRAVTDPF